MTGLVLVTLAAIAGSTARFVFDSTSRRWFPHGPSVGILTANVIGSFVLALVVGVVATHTVDDRWRLVVGTGFCGSFTTFSTLTVELAALADLGRRRQLVGWTAMSVVGGGVAAALGIVIGRGW